MVEVIIPYKPRELQKRLHDERTRFSVWVCHRRFGKTVLCINELIKEACLNKLDNPRFAYIAPFYRQAKQVAWDYLKLYTAPIPGVEVNESELRVTLPNGARIQLYGADNPDSLRGIYLDGVVLDEYAQMRLSLWGNVIRPALSDRKGWAVFIGTPMGHNAFWRMYMDAERLEDWSRVLFRASETGHVEPDELEAARRDMSEEEFEQEFECSFEAAIKGAYYGKLMTQAAKRITRVPYDPNLPVETAWDLGIGDPTAIWFVQLVGKEIHVIDYYENSGEGLAHYAKVLQTKPYVYGTHYGPHDLLAKEMGSGKTREETASELGLKFNVVPMHKIDDGINAARQILPLCWFDEENCADGIECLRQYRTEFDDKTQTFKDRPLHDWASHGADAFRYFAMGIRDRYVSPEPRWAATFDEYVQDHFKQARLSREDELI